MTKLDSFLESLLQESKAAREAIAKKPKTHRLWLKYSNENINFVDHHSIEFAIDVGEWQGARHPDIKWKVTPIDSPCPFE